jgi:Fanconi anemia group M protein
MIDIVVDDREDPYRIKQLRKYFDVTVKRLETGDIIINDNIAIEVKTRQDYISSCNNRRIQEEAIKMKQKYPYSYIICYNDGKLNSKYSRQTLAQRYSVMTSLTIRYHVPVFWVENFTHFIECIIAIINAVEKADKPIEVPNVRPKTSNAFENVLIGIDGVGKQTAKKLLKHFKKPSVVLNATEEELDEVPRLTKQVKRNILRL